MNTALTTLLGVVVFGALMRLPLALVMARITVLTAGSVVSGEGEPAWRTASPSRIAHLPRRAEEGEVRGRAVQVGV